MEIITLLDTSIYLNILNVPGCNQDRMAILKQLSAQTPGENRLLPMATIWETGNHIADLRDGGSRYLLATQFVKDILRAFQGETPYMPTYLPDKSEFISWLKDYPEHAKRSKKITKPSEGVSLADFSMIKEWERTRARNPRRRVRIWSLDQDLAGYDTHPT
ncbi:MAG: hypothetical protein HQL95_05820 [Magnetococcales bacterium]|nr:hypothetical protein [Magnetococcales bacterium]